LTPGEPTPYVCMYVSMVCGMYVFIINQTPAAGGDPVAFSHL